MVRIFFPTHHDHDPAHLLGVIDFILEMFIFMIDLDSRFPDAGGGAGGPDPSPNATQGSNTLQAALALTWKPLLRGRDNDRQTEIRQESRKQA